MRRTILMPLATTITAVTLAACEARYQPPEGYVPYRSDDLALTVHHPADWNTAYETDTRSVTLHDPTGKARVSIFASDTYPEGTSSADALANGVSRLAEATGGTFGAIEAFQSAAGETAVAQGQAPARLDVEGGEMLPDLHLYILALAAPDKVIFMNASATGLESFETFRPMFEEVFRSLQLD